jgi:hypothetical protein
MSMNRMKIESVHWALHHEANYRKNSNAMVGVTVARRLCSRCNTYGEVVGSRRIAGKFICPQCAKGMRDVR